MHARPAGASGQTSIKAFIAFMFKDFPPTLFNLSHHLRHLQMYECYTCYTDLDLVSIKEMSDSS